MGDQVGVWGGTCTCPNGQVYQVGAFMGHCPVLACINGAMGHCGPNNPGGSGVRVTCATHSSALTDVATTLKTIANVHSNASKPATRKAVEDEASEDELSDPDPMGAPDAEE